MLSATAPSAPVAGLTNSYIRMTYFVKCDVRIAYRVTVAVHFSCNGTQIIGITSLIWLRMCGSQLFLAYGIINKKREMLLYPASIQTNKKIKTHRVDVIEDVELFCSSIIRRNIWKWGRCRGFLPVSSGEKGRDSSGKGLLGRRRC